MHHPVEAEVQVRLIELEELHKEGLQALVLLTQQSPSPRNHPRLDPPKGSGLGPPRVDVQTQRCGGFDGTAALVESNMDVIIVVGVGEASWEVAALVDAMPARYKTLVIVGSYLGLRWQELAGLRRNAITLKGDQVPTLRVVSTIERSNSRYEVKEYGKSAAARRTLKMPAWVSESLTWHLRAFPHDEWVFPAPGGRFLRYDNFRHRVWSGATTAAGIAPFDFHELRHTAAALMISEGANALQVKRRMGHEDVRTTFNIYGHLFDDDEDALVQRLDQRARRASRRRDVGFLLGSGGPERVEGPSGGSQSAR